MVELVAKKYSLEKNSKLVVLRLVSIYKRFERQLARRADLIANGEIEKLELIIKGRPVEQVLNRHSLAASWNEIIKSSESDKV